MLRKIGVTLALALAVGGCKKNAAVPPPPCTVVIATPADDPAGQKPLRQWFDGTPTADGLQISVTGLAANCGDKVVHARVDSAPDLNSAISAPAGSFELKGVTVPAGAQTQTITVYAGDDPAANFAQVHVTYDATPLDGSIEVTSPANAFVFNTTNNGDPGSTKVNTNVCVTVVSPKNVDLADATIRVCGKFTAVDATDEMRGCKDAAAVEFKTFGYGTGQLCQPVTITTPAGFDDCHGYKVAFGAEVITKIGAVAILNTAPVSTVIDLVKPSLAWVEPTDGALLTTKTPTFKVAAVCIADGTHVVIMEGTDTVCDVAVLNGEATCPQPRIPLTAGAHTFELVGSDEHGNVAAVANPINVIVDVDGCDFRFVQPSTPDVTLSSTTPYCVTGATGMKCTFVGLSTRCPGGTLDLTQKGAPLSIHPTLKADGTVSFDVTFQDNDSGTITAKVFRADKNPDVDAPAQLTYTTDFGAPVITCDPLPDPVTTQPVTITCHITGAEEGQRVGITSDIVQYTAEGVGFVGANGDVSITMTLQPDNGAGQHLTAMVTDIAGNMGMSTFTAYVDYAGCVITVTNGPSKPGNWFGLNNTDLTGARRTFTFHASVKPECLITTAYLYRDACDQGSPLAAKPTTATNFDITVPTLADNDQGNFVICAKHAHFNGAAGMAVVPFKTDFTAPTVTAFTVATADATTGVTSTQQNTVNVTVGNWNIGSKLSISTTIVGGATTNVYPSTTMTANTASLTVNLPVGHQHLTATVVDPAGNSVSFPMTLEIIVDIVGCDAAFTPAITTFEFGKPNTAALSGSTRNATVQGNTSTCRIAGAFAKLTKTVGTVVSPAIQVPVDAATGNFTFTVPVTDSNDGTFQVQVGTNQNWLNAGISARFIADFTPPVVAWVTAANTLFTTVPAIVTVHVTHTDLLGRSMEGQTVTVCPGTGSCSGAALQWTGVVDASDNANISITNPAWAPGIFSAEVPDLVGNVGSAFTPLMFDQDGCAVVIDDPTSPAVFNLTNTDSQHQYTVVGHTTTNLCKPVSGVSVVAEFRLDGTLVRTVNLNADGTFSALIAFPPGSGNLNVKVVRTPPLASNAGVTMPYISGYSAPSITWTSPTPAAPYALVTALNPELTFAVTGSVTGQTLTVTSNAAGSVNPIGSAAASNGIATATNTVLVRGLQKLTAKITDIYGNTYTAPAIDVMVDTDGCAVSISGSTPTVFYTGNTNASHGYTVQGSTPTALCYGTGVTSKAIFTITGTSNNPAPIEAPVAANGTFSASVIFFPETTTGHLNVTVVRTSPGALAPNAGLNHDFTADYTAPVITWVTPPDLASPPGTLSSAVVSKTAPLVLSVVGADGQTVTVRSNQQTPAVGTCIVDATTHACTISSPNIVNTGRQTFTASVTDTSNNPNSKQAIVDVDDGTGCDAAFSTPNNWPANGIFNNVNTVTIGGAQQATLTGKTLKSLCWKDTAAGVSATAELRVNGVLVTADVNSSGTFSFSNLNNPQNGVPIPAGTGSISLRVTRTPAFNVNAGVTNSYTASYVNPTITWVTPSASNPVLLTLTSPITLTVTDAAGSTVSIKSAGGAVLGSATAVGNPATVTINPTTAWTYGKQQQLTATVTNSSGNVGTTVLTVDIDDGTGCDAQFTNMPANNTFNIANTNAAHQFSLAGKTTKTLCFGSGVSATAHYVLNGTEVATVPVSTTGTFLVVPGNVAPPITFPEGTGTIAVYVTRIPAASPNTGVTANYTADYTPPTVTFGQPGGDLIPATGSMNFTVVGATGQTLTMKRGTSSPYNDTGATVVGTATVAAGGLATVAWATALPAGTFGFRGIVSDTAGNSGFTDIIFTVDTTGCVVTVTSPVANAKFDATTLGSGSTRSINVTGTSAKCVGGTVTVTRTVGGNTTTATGTVQAGGSFSVPTNIIDGDVGSLNVKVVRTPPLSPNSGVDVAYAADFTPPAVTNLTPSATSFHIVNAGHPNAGQAGYVVDADPNTDGGQVNWSITFAGAGSITGSGTGSIIVSAPGNTSVQQTFTDNGSHTVSGTFTFPAGTTNALIAAALQDSFGNTTATGWTVLDVSVPPSIALSNPPSRINVASDLNNGKATNARINVVTANIGGAVATGSQAYLCSSVQIGAAPACHGSGYFQVASAAAAQGAVSFFSFWIAPGAQNLIAEYYDPATGGFSDSSPAALAVDIVPPAVSTFVAAADANHDNLVSGNELAAGAALVLNVTFTGVENGQQATLSEGSTTIATGSVSANAVAFNVSSPADGIHTYKVAVADAAGNPNEIIDAVNGPTADPKETLTLTLQRTPPSLLLSAPTFATCNQARDTIPATPNCDIDFVVQAGATAVGVEFSDAFGAYGTPQVLTSIVGSVATGTYSLGQGAKILRARAVDAFGVTSADVVVNLFVDTLAPTIQITNPDPAVQYVSTTQDFAITVSTTAEVNQRVAIVNHSAGDVEVGADHVVAGGTATINVHLNSSALPQTLIARVSDAAGNPSVDAAAATLSVALNLSGCDVNFTFPSSNLLSLNAGTGNSYLVQGTTACVGETVAFYTNTGSGDSYLGSTTATGGAFSYPITFGDGTRTVVKARITFGGTYEGSFTVYTDITSPTLNITAPVPDSANHLYVVAATGNVNVQNHVAGYVADADSATGGQVAFNITCTGCGDAVNSGTGKLSVTQGATEIYSQTITGNSAQVFTPVLTLTQGFSGALTITATDAANNAVLQSWTVVVDVVAPDAPALTSATLVNDHHADFDAVFTPTADSGPATNPLTWEFGYTTRTRLSGLGLDEAAFYNATLVKQLTVGSAPVAGAPTTMSVRGIEPLNTYAFAARVIDGVGNRSALVERTLANNWTKTQFSYPGTTGNTGYFGSPIATADVNNDGYPDLAVAAVGDGANDQGAVFIYYGGASGFTSTQTLAGTTASGYLGFALALVDLNGDGRADLITMTTSGAAVYFASNSSPALPSSPSFTLSGSSGVSMIRAIGDINGDGIADVALLDQYTGNGIVYIIYGRTAANWTAAVTSGTWAIGNADVIISGKVGGVLGAGNAIGAVPDINSDGKGELLLGEPDLKEVYLFLGSTLGTCGQTCTTTNAYETVKLTTGQNFGFSVAAMRTTNTAFDVDIVVGDWGAKTVHVFNPVSQGCSGGTCSAPAWSVTSTSPTFGWNLTVADLNLDTRPDLVVGTNDSGMVNVGVLWSSSTGLAHQIGSMIPGGSSFGESIVVGNFYGASSPDIVVGEFANGNGIFSIFH